MEDESNQVFSPSVYDLCKIILTQTKTLMSISFMLKNMDHSGFPKAWDGSEIARIVQPLLTMSAVSGKSLVDLLDSATNVHSCYGVARSILECNVNCAYMIVSDKKVAIAAHEHATQRFYRNSKYSREVGGLEIKVSAPYEFSETERLEELVVKFSTKKGHPRSWTDLNIYQRIDKINTSMADKQRYWFPAAVSQLYEVSSEYLHGTYFSSMHYYGHPSTSKRESYGDEELLKILESHALAALSGVFMANEGLIACFYQITNWEPLEKLEQLFYKKFKSVPKIAQAIEANDLATIRDTKQK